MEKAKRVILVHRNGSNCDGVFYFQPATLTPVLALVRKPKALILRATIPEDSWYLCSPIEAPGEAIQTSMSLNLLQKAPLFQYSIRSQKNLLMCRDSFVIMHTS